MATALAGSGAHLVHVGSAAEYGVPADPRPLSEESVCSPTSDYGVTKLSGTQAVLDAMPTATVLRPFNVVDADLPHGSPMSDIGDRISRAITSQTPVEVLAASTIRDYVSRQFVIESISAAARLRPAGVFNVCSGVGVSTGDIARMVLDDRQMPNAITSSDDSQSSTIIGDPTRWRALTGLAEALGCRGIVETLGWSESIGS
jgi:nucleoside-diphosphate-sugar epimerase